MGYGKLIYPRRLYINKEEKMARKLRVGVTKNVFPRPFFESIVRKHLPEALANLVMLAYRQAKCGHHGQIREDRSRYFDHAKSVALIFMLELKIFKLYILIASLLHDIKEKSFSLKQWDIERIFGRMVRKAVDILTKERGIDYHKRLEEAIWWIKMIKLVDRLHNLRTLLSCKEYKKRKQLQETRDFYIPLAMQLIEEAPKEFKNQANYLLEEIEWACQRAGKTLK